MIIYLFESILQENPVELRASLTLGDNTKNRERGGTGILNTSSQLNQDGAPTFYFQKFDGSE